MIFYSPTWNAFTLLSCVHFFQPSLIRDCKRQKQLGHCQTEKTSKINSYRFSSHEHAFILREFIPEVDDCIDMAATYTHKIDISPLSVWQLIDTWLNVLLFFILSFTHSYIIFLTLVHCHREWVHQLIGRFPFSQNFRNFWFGVKWNTFRRFIPLENSQKKWKI